MNPYYSCMNPSSFSGIYKNLFGVEVAVFLYELKDNLLTVQISTPDEDGKFECKCYEVSVSFNNIEYITFMHESIGIVSGEYIDLIFELINQWAWDEPYDIKY